MKINKKYKLIIFLVFFLAFGAFNFFLKAQEHTRPNIILITIDALRPDHLGYYGYKRNTSPNIDALSKEGVLFNQAISQGPNTFISLPTIITSSLPYTHGVFNCGDFINASSETLAEILKNQGYSTGLISGYDLFAKIGGLNRGFDTFKYGPSLKLYSSKHCFIYDARKITNLAIKWLTKNRNKPFFLWIHYFEVHGFYKNLPSKYKRMFLHDGLFYKENKQVLISDKSNNVYDGFKHIPYYILERGKLDLNYYIAQYDAAIRYVDEQIGGLLETLKRLNIYENTIMVITADHGESLGEHNFYLDHASLYDEVIKIPLIIKYHDKLPNGKTIDSQVQSIDIVPTILDILKIKFNKKEGSSLLPLILLNQEQPLAYAPSMSHDGISIRTEYQKLIYNLTTDSYELYNLKDDPQELNNLVSIEKNKFESLKEKLDEYKWKDFQEKVNKPILDKETKERLKSLGYAQ